MCTLDRRPSPPTLRDSTQSRELTTRRSFIGGSDARIIMGDEEALSCAFGAKNAGRSSRRTSPATWSSNSVSPPRTSIGAGTRPIPDT